MKDDIMTPEEVLAYNSGLEYAALWLQYTSYGEQVPWAQNMVMSIRAAKRVVTQVDYSDAVRDDHVMQLLAEVRMLRNNLREAQAERDEARGEVERLQAKCIAYESRFNETLDAFLKQKADNERDKYASLYPRLEQLREALEAMDTKLEIESSFEEKGETYVAFYRVTVRAVVQDSWLDSRLVNSVIRLWADVYTLSFNTLFRIA